MKDSLTTGCLGTKGQARRMPRALVFALCLPLAALVAGCGGDSSDGEAAKTEASPASLQARLDAQPGENVGLVLGTSDFVVGENRVSFLVVGNNGKLITTPTAKVYVARGLAEKPESTASAQLLKLDPYGAGQHTQEHAEPDTESLFVTRLNFRQPGDYWFVVDLPGKPTQGLVAVKVKDTGAAPVVGATAIPSDNPTLDDAPAEKITTARPPDTELLKSSIKEAMAAKVPFVAVFATPAYCESRTCGPTVEIVEEVRRRVSPTKTRFIHVEVYKENDPAKGVNKFMTEWKLPSEPWIFVVDSTGIIRERFEGSASVEELEAAVRELS